ncbi:hypothetical protein LCGC14_2121340, partial [marine sediment metagenome]
VNTEHVGQPGVKVFGETGVTYSTSEQLLQLVQANRVERELLVVNLNKMKKPQLRALIEDALLPHSKKALDEASVNKMRSWITEARGQRQVVIDDIVATLLDVQTEEDVAKTFIRLAEGDIPLEAVVQARGAPTQLITGESKLATRLKRIHDQAFAPGQSLEFRQARITEYIEEVEKVRGKTTAAERAAIKVAEETGQPEVQSVRRLILDRDIKLARWDFDTRFGIKPFPEAQDNIREGFRILTTEHRGTPEERLAKLATGRAKEINEGIDDFLRPFQKLNKVQLDRFRERILTQVLDAELGSEIFDVGRQLETMFTVAPVGRGTKTKAFAALKTLTTKGATPTPSEIDAMRTVLDPVLGAGTTSQLLNARKLTTKGGELVINSMGLSRAIMASSDWSAILRQAAVLGPRMPIQWAKMAGRAVRAFMPWQSKYAQEIRASIINSGVIRLSDGELYDMYALAKRSDLFLASDANRLGASIGELAAREEEWMTAFTSKLGWHLFRDSAGKTIWNPLKWPAAEKKFFPFPLAQSERAYIYPLDKLRMDYFGNEARMMVERGMRNGRPPTMEDFQQLALWVNNATGRGKLPKVLKDYGFLLNIGFFAPKLIISRITTPVDVFRHIKRGGPMRRVVLETLAADAVAFTGGMYLLNVSLQAAGIDTQVNYTNPIK